MSSSEVHKQAVESVLARLTGRWADDADMLAEVCDGLKSAEADELRNQLRRMIIRVMEYELIKNATGSVQQGYREYIADSGSMPVAVEAFRLFVEQLNRAVNGDTDAAFLLGSGYLNGIFGRISYRFTHMWYGIAAQNGHAQAQFNLGVCYQNGEGVEQDYSEALKLFEQSAASGYTKARVNIGIYHSNGWGVPQGKDEKKAFDCFEQAAADGNEGAMYHLALCYLKGEGTAVDPALGLQWMLEAAKRGSTDALDLIARAEESKNDIH